MDNKVTIGAPGSNKGRSFTREYFCFKPSYETEGMVIGGLPDEDKIEMRVKDNLAFSIPDEKELEEKAMYFRWSKEEKESHKLNNKIIAFGGQNMKKTRCLAYNRMYYAVRHGESIVYLDRNGEAYKRFIISLKGLEYRVYHLEVRNWDDIIKFMDYDFEVLAREKVAFFISPIFSNRVLCHDTSILLKYVLKTVLNCLKKEKRGKRVNYIFDNMDCLESKSALIDYLLSDEVKNENITYTYIFQYAHSLSISLTDSKANDFIRSCDIVMNFDCGSNQNPYFSSEMNNNYLSSLFETEPFDLSKENNAMTVYVKGKGPIVMKKINMVYN